MEWKGEGRREGGEDGKRNSQRLRASEEERDTFVSCCTVQMKFLARTSL